MAWTLIGKIKGNDGSNGATGPSGVVSASAPLAYNASTKALSLDLTNLVSAGAFDEHTENDQNPHNTNKAQIGLGNVPNVDATNAANISSGTLSAARLPSVFSNVTQIYGPDNSLVYNYDDGETFLYGDGRNIINITKEHVGLGNVANVDTSNAANISSGILPSARIGALPYVHEVGNSSIDGSLYLSGSLNAAELNIADYATVGGINTIDGYDNNFNGFSYFNADVIFNGHTRLPYYEIDETYTPLADGTIGYTYNSQNEGSDVVVAMQGSWWVLNKTPLIVPIYEGGGGGGGQIEHGGEDGGQGEQGGDGGQGGDGENNGEQQG